MAVDRDNLIWLDLEMTGLNPDTDRILEIATIVTDKNLNVLAEGPVFAIHQVAELLEGMDHWNTSHHNASGLVKRVQNEGVNEQAAEQETLEFLRTLTEQGTSPMCGNSICQDRRFLWRYMPQLEAWFHYRNLDVSTLKELTRRWSPEILKDFEKQEAHLALADIRESIEEMRFYRQRVMSI